MELWIVAMKLVRHVLNEAPVEREKIRSDFQFISFVPGLQMLTQDSKDTIHLLEV